MTSPLYGFRQIDLNPPANLLVEDDSGSTSADFGAASWLQQSDLNPNADPLVEDDAGPEIAYHNFLQRSHGSDLNNFANPLAESDAGPTVALIATSDQISGLSQQGTAATSPPVTAQITATFAGPSFDSVGLLNGGEYMIPPDNASAVGATIVNTANPHYNMTPLVLATNGEIEFVSSSGALLAPAESLDSFFGTNAFIFDPKVTYDAVNHRFVVVALEQSDSPDTSEILVAVSKHNDPSLGWNYLTINSETQVPGDGGGSWADFPGLATDGKEIYVTANLFSHATGNYEGSRLWIVGDGVGTGGVYDGGNKSSVRVYDPSTLSGASSTSTNDLFTLQPSQIYGAAPFNGIFLVAYDGDTLKGGSGNALDVIEVRHVLAANPTFAYQQVGVGNIDAAPQYSSFTAPQPGTTTAIDAGDDRVLSVVYNNGHLYAAADVLPPSGPDAGHVTAHWFNLSTANLAVLSVAGQGNVSGSAIGPGVRTYYPSIVADRAGNFVVNVSASGPSLYAGAYYAVHLTTDSPNTIETPVSFAAGVASYVRTFGYGDNRWGDFTSITLQPGTENFLAFNEYAAATGTIFLGENGRWATTVAQISLTGTTGPVAASNTVDVALSAAILYPEHAGLDHQRTGSAGLDTGHLASLHYHFNSNEQTIVGSVSGIHENAFL